MTRKLIIVAAISVVSICAHAQPAPADSPEKAKARVLLKEGVRLLDAGQLAPALHKFEDAYAAFPSAKILVNIGTAQSGLGRSTDAANTYQRYLDSGNDDPVQRPAVTAALAELDATLGRLAVKIRGTASSAIEIRIAHGSWTPLSPGGLARVAPGRFDLQARAAAGAREVTVSGTIAAREQRDIIVDLAAQAPPRGAATTSPESSSRAPAQGLASRGAALPSEASLRAAAPGSASDFAALPAESSSRAPAPGSANRTAAPPPEPSSRTAAPGSASRTAAALPESSSRTGAPGSTTPAVVDGESTAVPSPSRAMAAHVSAEPPVPASRWTPLRQGAVVAGAVGVAGLTAMTVLALRARSLWNEAQPNMNTALARQAATRANLATGAGVVGVAALGAGVVLWLVGAPSNRSVGDRRAERKTVTAFVDRTHVGLAIAGGF